MRMDIDGLLVFPSRRYRVVSLLLVSFMLVASASISAAGSLPRIETETLDKKPFVFPDDLRGAKLNIVMLAISEEQENGTWQGDALVEWYAALDQASLLSNDVMAWHISVLKVPFFVKGLVRNGMADSYKGKIPLDQAAAIFVKNIAAFAETAGITIDSQPTILLVSPAGEILNTVKGPVSDENLSLVSAAIRQYMPSSVAAGSAD